MLISRSPLRISLGGGASDVPSYYLQHGGLVISAAIDQYVYTTINQTNEDHMLLRYSQIERPINIEDIKHPIIREALKLVGISEAGIEITSMADQSAGTGLGSSGSFTTALLKMLYRFVGKSISAEKLAELACYIELDILGDHCGKQDQYISAYGGTTVFEFDKNGTIKAVPLKISNSFAKELQNSFIMIPTGQYRSASAMLKDQDIKSKENNTDMINNLHYIKEIGYKSLEALEKEDLHKYSMLVNEHWLWKKLRSEGISNPNIDKLYDFGMLNGASAAKVCFAPDTLIKTPNGYLPIKDLSINDKVFDHQNNIQNINDVMKRKYNGKILKIKMSGVKEPLYTTPEHPLFTSIKDPKFQRELNDAGRKQAIINLPIFKEAKFFKKGDCLLVPINNKIVDIETIIIERKIKQHINSAYDIYNNIPNKIDVNFDLLNMLGWYIAEGSSNSSQFQFVMHKDEIDDGATIIQNIKNIFNRHASLKIKNNSLIIVSSSTVLSPWISELCGKYAKNKHIPEFVMYLPPQKQAILLSALWKGDGCIRHSFDKRMNKSYIRCSYKTVSPKLAKQVQELCFRLGFISSIREEKNIKPKIILNNKKETFPQDAYSVCIDGDDAIAFEQFINTGKIVKVKRRNNKKLSLKKDILKIDNIYYVKRSITSIQEIDYDGDVFNLNVENSHTYIANDIAVHNCGAGGGGFLLCIVPTKKQSGFLAALKNAKLKHMEIMFDYEGSKLL